MEVNSNLLYLPHPFRSPCCRLDSRLGTPQSYQLITVLSTDIVSMLKWFFCHFYYYSDIFASFLKMLCPLKILSGIQVSGCENTRTIGLWQPYCKIIILLVNTTSTLINQSVLNYHSFINTAFTTIGNSGSSSGDTKLSKYMVNCLSMWTLIDCCVRFWTCCFPCQISILQLWI